MNTRPQSFPEAVGSARLESEVSSSLTALELSLSRLDDLIGALGTRLQVGGVLIERPVSNKQPTAERGCFTVPLASRIGLSTENVDFVAARVAALTEDLGV